MMYGGANYVVPQPSYAFVGGGGASNFYAPVIAVSSVPAMPPVQYVCQAQPAVSCPGVCCHHQQQQQQPPCPTPEPPEKRPTVTGPAVFWPSPSTSSNYNAGFQVDPYDAAFKNNLIQDDDDGDDKAGCTSPPVNSDEFVATVQVADECGRVRGRPAQSATSSCPDANRKQFFEADQPSNPYSASVVVRECGSTPAAGNHASCPKHADPYQPSAPAPTAQRQDDGYACGQLLPLQPPRHQNSGRAVAPAAKEPSQADSGSDTVLLQYQHLECDMLGVQRQQNRQALREQLAQVREPEPEPAVSQTCSNAAETATKQPTEHRDPWEEIIATRMPSNGVVARSQGALNSQFILLPAGQRPSEPPQLNGRQMMRPNGSRNVYAGGAPIPEGLPDDIAALVRRQLVIEQGGPDGYDRGYGDRGPAGQQLDERQFAALRGQLDQIKSPADKQRYVNEMFGFLEEY